MGGCKRWSGAVRLEGMRSYLYTVALADDSTTSLVATEEPGASAVDQLGRYTVYLIILFVTIAVILRIRTAVDRYRIRRELNAPPSSIFPEDGPAPQLDIPTPNVELDADPFA